MSQNQQRPPEVELTTNGKQPVIALSFVLIAWLIFAVAIPAIFLQPSKPIPDSADAKIFSAKRAIKTLEHLVGDGIPHPAGSEQNDVVRERIITLLTEYGYEPRIQKTSNTRWRAPNEEIFPLENIMARLPGKKPGRAVLLASHYDSVPAGPGASDDGVGTAALLEVAKMLKSEGPFEHDIIFLITDGEELGLLGADKFVELHPWAREVECVVNLEARGTTGPSFMFETSEHSRWLIPTFAKSVPRPMTSSLFYEVYKQLPNDTDFTMFKRGNMQGFNFAFIGNVNAYHTPDDNFENADIRSLQHHGENMLGLARELADIDFDAQPEGQVVYFDVLGLMVIWWPANWSLILSALAFAFVLATSLTNTTHVELKFTTRAGVIVIGLFVGVATIALLMGIGFILNKTLAFDGAFDHPWPNYPWFVPFSFFGFGLTAVAAIAWFVKPLSSAKAAWASTWSIWAAMAIFVSIASQGASYLFIVPALAAGIIGICFRKANSMCCPAAIGALVCGFIWLPMEALFFDALGFRPLGVNLLMVRATIVCFTTLPVFMCCQPKSLGKITVVLGGATIIALLGSLLM